jgi:outer membrane protein OmpA-like peptidoglycan-associated protein
MMGRTASTIGLVALLLPVAAHADNFLTAEVPAAVAVSAAQEGVYRAGAMPAVGAYLGLSPRLALGLRLRAGVLRDGPAPSGGMKDPALGGLGTGTVALRLGAGGGWAELAAGAGVTGHDVVPTVEAGIGYEFAVAGLHVGPSVRFAHVGTGNSMATLGAADLVLFGVEASFASAPAPTPPSLRPSPSPWGTQAPAAPTPPPTEPPPCGAHDASCQPDTDHDGIVDADDRCPNDAETVNGVDDFDGCPDAGSFEVKDDRIVLPEHVLFDVNRARVKSAGREVIKDIATALAAHPEWVHMTIEGHADVRGPEAFNATLSQDRASRVRDVLLRAGVAADRVDAVGYGATRPRAPGDDEAAHQRNRRVEFVIQRGTP